MRMQRFDDERIARTLEADGAPAGLPDRIMAALDDEQRAQFRRSMKRAVGVGAGLCAAGAALDFLLGTSRSIGVILLLGVAAVIGMAVTWLWRSVRQP
jgi:uncharacterized membrane protein YccC